MTGTRLPRSGTIAALAALVIGVFPGTGARAAAAEVRPSVDTVTCVPGGVAAVPLTPGAGALPARIAVTVGGLRTSAPVVRVAGGGPALARHWTRSPERIVAWMASEQAPAGIEPATADAFAMIELPATGEGDLEVDGAAVRARWLPAPQRARRDAPLLAIPATVSDDRPDPAAPVEYFRWALVAAKQGARIGEPRGTAAERLWARHVDSLWAAGLERVRGRSRGVHAELLDVLTGCVEDLDAGRSVAAWIARPAELRSLLAILVDAERGDEDVTRAALTWLRARWTVTAWIEEDAGDRVLLAVANPGAGEVVLRCEWLGGDTPAPPSSAVAVPKRLTRTWIERPHVVPPDGDPLAGRDRAEVLEIRSGELRMRMAVGAREYPVRPPGLSFGSFLPPLSLADAQAAAIEPVAAEWATTASLRRRAGRWEVMIEAMRPAGAPDPSLDEVIVRFGDPASPDHAFAVTASGALEMRHGGDDGVAAGFMAWSDRWRARVELPEAWLPAGGPDARPMLVSLERSPGPGAARQAAALARPPWRAHAPAVMVDLAAWGGEAR